MLHYLPPLLFTIWLSFQVFYRSLVPWIFKNTKGDFSTTHSPCRKRRKLLGNGYPYVQWGLWPHPIQSEWKNVGITYKRPGGLGTSIHPSYIEPGLFSPSSFIERILPSSHPARFGMIFWKCLLPPNVMNQMLRILRSWKS